MSNRIVRLGGSNIGNNHSIHHLIRFLAKSEERKFVVVSAVPGLLQLIQKSLEEVFQQQLNTDEIVAAVYAEYSQRLGQSPSDEYKKLTEQLVNLLKGITLIGDYSRALKDQVISYSEKLTVEMLRVQWSSVSDRC